MGFFHKLKSALDPGHFMGKVLDPLKLRKRVDWKTVAPIAVGFIPGAGPALSATLAAYNKKRGIQKEARDARKMSEFGAGAPNMDLDAMQAAQLIQNRFPQPSAFAAPRLAGYTGQLTMADRAKRLAGISGSVRGVPLQQRIRAANAGMAFKLHASRTRLRAKFNRAPVLHMATGGLASHSPTARYAALRGGRATATVAVASRRRRRPQRSRRPRRRRAA